MPNVKSAVKRVRQCARRTTRNRALRSTFRSSLKSAQKALDAGDPNAAREEVRATLSVIGKSEKKGIVHANKAARHASRLAKRLHALTKGQSGAPAASTPPDTDAPAPDNAE
jgi:small subunit ribosomal protein S20